MACKVYFVCYLQSISLKNWLELTDDQAFNANTKVSVTRSPGGTDSVDVDKENEKINK